MKMMLLTVAGCSLLMAVIAARGAMLPGSHPREWPANAARHKISITRAVANAAEKKMIEAAEAAAPGTQAWWSGVQNNIQKPFALTKDALAYYEGKIQGYQKKGWKTYIEPSSSMEYKAGVALHAAFELNGKTYKDVYVVTLRLTFDANFTEEVTTGVHFDKQRTVVLDARGAVQAIGGDGETEMPMLAI